MNANFDPIEIGPRVPRRGHRWSQRIIVALFRAAGWRFAGRIPDQPKMVLIGAPHTSNWDFLFAMVTVFGLGLNCHWLGKHTLFNPVTNSILRWAGGIPVNRRRPGTIIHDVIRQIDESEQFLVGLSPEGTRSVVSQWKVGFHRIAVGAHVPILPGSIDFSTRTLRFHPLYEPCGDFETDVRRLKKIYERVTPLRKEGFAGH